MTSSAVSSVSPFYKLIIKLGSITRSIARLPYPATSSEFCHQVYQNLPTTTTTTTSNSSCRTFLSLPSSESTSPPRSVEHPLPPASSPDAFVRSIRPVGCRAGGEEQSLDTESQLHEFLHKAKQEDLPTHITVRVSWDGELTPPPPSDLLHTELTKTTPIIHPEGYVQLLKNFIFQSKRASTTTTTSSSSRRARVDLGITPHDDDVSKLSSSRFGTSLQDDDDSFSEWNQLSCGTAWGDKETNRFLQLSDEVTGNVGGTEVQSGLWVGNCNESVMQQTLCRQFVQSTDIVDNPFDTGYWIKGADNTGTLGDETTGQRFFDGLGKQVDVTVSHYRTDTCNILNNPEVSTSVRESFAATAAKSLPVARFSASDNTPCTTSRCTSWGSFGNLVSASSFVSVGSLPLTSHVPQRPLPFSHPAEVLQSHFYYSSAKDFQKNTSVPDGLNGLVSRVIEHHQIDAVPSFAYSIPAQLVDDFFNLLNSTAESLGCGGVHFSLSYKDRLCDGTAINALQEWEAYSPPKLFRPSPSASRLVSSSSYSFPPVSPSSYSYPPGSPSATFLPVSPVSPVPPLTKSIGSYLSEACLVWITSVVGVSTARQCAVYALSSLSELALPRLLAAALLPSFAGVCVVSGVVCVIYFSGKMMYNHYRSPEKVFEITELSHLPLQYDQRFATPCAPTPSDVAEIPAIYSMTTPILHREVSIERTVDAVLTTDLEESFQHVTVDDEAPEQKAVDNKFGAMTFENQRRVSAEDPNVAAISKVKTELDVPGSTPFLLRMITFVWKTHEQTTTAQGVGNGVEKVLDSVLKWFKM